MPRRHLACATSVLGAVAIWGCFSPSGEVPDAGMVTGSGGTTGAAASTGGAPSGTSGTVATSGASSGSTGSTSGSTGVDAGPTVTTLSGNGQAGWLSGTGGAVGTAELEYLQSVAVDTLGNVYVVDQGDGRVGKIDSSGELRTLAGNGSYGWVDGTGGPSGTAEFAYPIGVAVDAVGNVYVGDSFNNRVRKIDSSGNVTTLAGNGREGSVDGTGGPSGTAELYGPAGVAVDPFGNVFVAELPDNSVRKIDPTGNVTTLIGADTLDFNAPFGIAVDQFGNVYVADTKNNRIAEIDQSGNVTTLAGNGTPGYADGTGGPSGTAEMEAPFALAVDGLGNVYVGDETRVRLVQPDGIVTTVAGNGIDGWRDGTGGPNGTAEFSDAIGVAVDSSGNIYVADTGNNRVRLIHP